MPDVPTGHSRVVTRRLSQHLSIHQDSRPMFASMESRCHRTSLDQVNSVSTERAARRSRASTADFAACASRLMTRRLGKPQNSSSFGHGVCRYSCHTRKSGIRWSTSALFHNRLPVWPHRRACRRRRKGASPLGAFQNSHAITQAQCQFAFLLAPALHRSTCQPKR